MNYRRWIGVLSITLWAAGWATPAVVHADSHGSDGYTIDDLQMDSAGDLFDVCTIDTQHEHHAAALAFCYGFFEGAIHYDRAISGADDHIELVCSPEGTTRNQAVEVFLSYMKTNAQYQSEPPIDGIFRALMARWPCTK